MLSVDKYIQRVIGDGDVGSNILASLTAPTLENSKLVHVISEGMHGLAGLRIPNDMFVVVHSASGDPRIFDIQKHSISMIERLVVQAENIEVQPVALANVVDSKDGNLDLITIIGSSMREAANNYGVAILNGENAILGSRVNGSANVSGTMISIASKDRFSPGFFSNGVDNYAIFDPQGKFVWINSDGVGTKPEFYERLKNHQQALYDSLAMKI